MSEGRKTKNNSNDKKATGNTTLTRWIYLWMGLVAIVAIVVIVFLPKKNKVSRDNTMPPKIAFSETLWKFGRTPQQSSLSHTFWIKNVGGGILRILDVKPG